MTRVVEVEHLEYIKQWTTVTVPNSTSREDDFVNLSRHGSGLMCPPLIKIFAHPRTSSR